MGGQAIQISWSSVSVSLSELVVGSVLDSMSVLSVSLSDGVSVSLSDGVSVSL